MRKVNNRDITLFFAILSIIILAYKFSLMLLDQYAKSGEYLTFHLGEFGDSRSFRTGWALRFIPSEIWFIYSHIMEKNYLKSFGFQFIYFFWFLIQITVLNGVITHFISTHLKKSLNRTEWWNLFAIATLINYPILWYFNFRAYTRVQFTYDIPDIYCTLLVFTYVFKFLNNPKNENLKPILILIPIITFVKETTLIPILFLLAALFIPSLIKSVDKNLKYKLFGVLAITAIFRSLYARFIMPQNPGATAYLLKDTKHALNWNIEMITLPYRDYMLFNHPLNFVLIFLGLFILVFFIKQKKEFKMITILSSLFFFALYFYTAAFNESRGLLSYTVLLLNFFLLNTYGLVVDKMSYLDPNRT